MYIYNRINTFRQVVGGGSGIAVATAVPKTKKTVPLRYKINRRKPFRIIKNRPVRGSGRIARNKLKALTKKNKTFLTQLGFKLLKKK